MVIFLTSFIAKRPSLTRMTTALPSRGSLFVPTRQTIPKNRSRIVSPQSHHLLHGQPFTVERAYLTHESHTHAHVVAILLYLQEILDKRLSYFNVFIDLFFVDSLSMTLNLDMIFKHLKYLKSCKKGVKRQVKCFTCLTIVYDMSFNLSSIRYPLLSFYATFLLWWAGR